MRAGEVLVSARRRSAADVTAGYAKYDIVDVAGRLGISRFLGYDPIAIDVPILFEGYIGNARASDRARYRSSNGSPAAATTPAQRSGRPPCARQRH